MPDIVLQTESLTKRFGLLTAVDGLSLQVYAGEVFGLLGPNGAGKTTSINMMSGLLKPDSGRVLIHGKRVNEGDASIRLRVGVCPQYTVLWEKLTCIEQLEFIGEMYNLPLKIARHRGEALLEILELSEQHNKLASQLSGGMRRRLNLALALVHDPEILVLDEPEAGLDPQSRVLVRDYIKSLASHKTIILTTHNMDEAERLADRVAVIDHGKLLVLDTPDALKRTLGEGDVLEVIVSRGDLESAQAFLSNLGLEQTLMGDMIILRAHKMVGKIPLILDLLREAGVQVQDVRLRANTLEDVFISITGRRLRE